MNDELRIFNYNDAVELAKRGNLIARQSWNNEYGIVFWRPEDTIPRGIIPNIKSIPDHLKTYIEEDGGTDDIFFTGYLARYASSSVINAWQASVEDMEAEDWYLVKV